MTLNLAGTRESILSFVSVIPLHLLLADVMESDSRVGVGELMMSRDDVLMMPAAAGRNEFSLITPMKTLAEVSSLFRFLAESGFDGGLDSRFGEAVIDRFFGKPAAIK
jgi:hypothetical protein